MARTVSKSVTLSNLQYKMFLLNIGQNIAINGLVGNLQYKMFLLNEITIENGNVFFRIYNTKCSY